MGDDLNRLQRRCAILARKDVDSTSKGRQLTRELADVDVHPPRFGCSRERERRRVRTQQRHAARLPQHLAMLLRAQGGSA